MNHFFAFLARMKFIQRWGLMRNTQPENIQEHSLQTAVIAHGLAIIGNRHYNRSYNPERVMALGVFHEVSEIITGDLPSPIKHRDPALHTAYSRLEEAARKRVYGMLPADLQPDYHDLLFANDTPEHLALVKAADKLCAYLKCLEEQKGGNSEFDLARQVLEEDIKSIELPEVQHFIEHFTPSFLLTLDELNR
ncbi:MAG: 5'-deoxynucleotidase [Gemmatimonadetes bacterium]|jgi:5'-deoxynucleotidase|nr:5'-deoxynucleotidase [Gemmatimonadota bacterium]MBT6147843.1 5'-deoxynucleotidase [Gemmatimonadota bacterium]MBT7861265.1 5'-deoxynucleotidase [Gemmatimonadota bacterium]